MISMVLFLGFVFQLFDEIGHILLITAFFGFELPQESIDFAVLFFFQQIEFHSETPTLNFQVHGSILFCSDLFMQPTVFFKGLFDLSIFVGKFYLKLPMFVSLIFYFLIGLFVFAEGFIEFLLELILDFLHCLDVALVLLVHSALALQLALELVDCLLQNNFIAEQLVDLTHAVSYHYLQLLLFQVHCLQFLEGDFGGLRGAIPHKARLVGSHRAGNGGFCESRFVLVYLCILIGRWSVLNRQTLQYLVFLPEFFQDLIAGDRVSSGGFSWQILECSKVGLRAGVGECVRRIEIGIIRLREACGLFQFDFGAGEHPFNQIKQSNKKYLGYWVYGGFSIGSLKRLNIFSLFNTPKL